MCLWYIIVVHLYPSIVAAYQFDMNEVIYRDLKISYIQDKVKIFAKKHAKKLELHTKTTAKQYLD